MCYRLNYDVRYFFDDENIYFRKGVWNTIDGLIPFSQIEDKENFIQFLISLKESKNSLQNRIMESLSKKDRELIADLEKNKFILAEEKKDSLVYQVLTGQNIKSNGKKIEFQVISDMNFIYKQLDEFSSIYKYSYSKVNDDLIRELKDLNYFSKVDSVNYEKKIDYVRRFFSFEKPVLILLKHINLALLRNINEVLENVPLFIGFLDEPFMMFLSIIPKQTACWNCFEQRMLAFVKDSSLYERFIKINFSDIDSETYNLHFIHLLHMGLQEIFSWNLLQMSKFMGRCMFIYLPTMEIHFQDINKIPSCPSCGYISQNSNFENNALLGELVDNYMAEINKNI